MQLKNLCATDDNGNVLAGASFYFLHADGSGPALQLQDADGNALENPVMSVSGELEVRAPNGEYDVVISTPTRSTTKRVQFVDVGDAVDVAMLMAQQPVVLVDASGTVGVTKAWCYLSCINAGDIVLSVASQSTDAWGTSTSITIRPSATGTVRLAGDDGVTLRPAYGGTLLLLPGMTAALKRVGPDVWDVIGQTVAA